MGNDINIHDNDSNIKPSIARMVFGVASAERRCGCTESPKVLVAGQSPGLLALGIGV